MSAHGGAVCAGVLLGGALGRQPNPQELGQWAALIGASFGQARLEQAKALGDTIFLSAEYAARQRSDEEYVADLYWTYLQRPPDVDGLKFWVERIALQGRDGVREGFEVNNEFAAQVGGICTPGQPTGEVLWVMQDHQGSTRAMLNSAGQVVGRHDALPFGDTTGEGNEVGPQAPADETTGLHGWWNTVRQRYADLERDASTGLEHATFRKYEPWAGRWTSPDPYLGSMNPVDPQSFNRYAYVQNDPVNFVDPNGLNLAAPRPFIGTFTVDITVSWIDGIMDSFDASFGGNFDWLSDGPGSDTGDDFGGTQVGPQNPIPRTASDIKYQFYLQYGQQLNNCLQQIAGNNFPRQTILNAPRIDGRFNARQVGRNSGVREALGSSTSRGPNDTVLIAAELINGNSPNTLNAIFGTYVHELGNILDIRLNPNVPAQDYGRIFGDHVNPPNGDTDTGANLERCVFGSLQYP